MHSAPRPFGSDKTGKQPAENGTSHGNVDSRVLYHAGWRETSLASTREQRKQAFGTHAQTNGLRDVRRGKIKNDAEALCSMLLR